jgi:hypothetical protein
VAYYLRVPEAPCDVYVKATTAEDADETSLGRIMTELDFHVSQPTVYHICGIMSTTLF